MKLTSGSYLEILTHECNIGLSYEFQHQVFSSYITAAIAFSAGLSADKTIAGGSKVVYNQILLDLNQVYDRTTGDFVAPVGGVYEFTYHALGQMNETIWLDLYKNYM